MKTAYFSSRVDWWIYAVVLFTVVCCMVGPLITSDDYLFGILLAGLLVGIEIFTFTSVKYAIRGNELGIRMFYRWQWFPIDKISEVKKVTSMLSSAALSTQRVAIIFSDRKILKSNFPLEISPKDRSTFISNLQTVNPGIRYN